MTTEKEAITASSPSGDCRFAVRQQPIMFCSDYLDQSPPGNDISVAVSISQPVRRSVIGIAAPDGRLIDIK